MNFFKNYISVIAITILGGFAFYLSGCASAESTTGKLAYKEGDFQKAATELAKGLLVDKNDAEGWFMLGHSQIEIGKYDEAKNSFARSLAISPNYGNDILNLWITKYNDGIGAFNAGLTALGSQNTEGAQRNFGNALNLFKATSVIIPDSTSSYQMIAESYYYLDKNDSALIIFEAIISKTTDENDALQIARILYDMGIKARQAERYNESISLFSKITQIPALPHGNEFYEVAIYNIAYANYALALESIAEDPDADFKPYMQEIVRYLEPLIEESTNEEIISDSLELLIVAYDALGMTDKKEQAEAKKESLKN